MLGIDREWQISLQTFKNRKWLLALAPLFAAGAALFVWSVAGALNHHGPVRALLAVAAGAGLLCVWLLESGILSRALRRPYAGTAGQVALSWIPLAVLPLSAPYFSHRVVSMFLQNHFTTTRVLALALWLLALAVAGSIVLKLLMFWKRSGAVIDFLDRHAMRILVAGAALYFIVFTSLDFLAFHWFAGAYHSDLGQYNQTLWATIRGHVFYSVGLEETSGSYLGTHVSPFLLIVVAPLYALWQSPMMYLMLRTLALSLAAVPLFYCVRRFSRSGAAALLLVAAFLFHPEIVSQNFTSGYETIFVAAPFFAAFYFFLEKRFGLFFAFLVVTISVREDFIPAAIIFGIYALIQRRSAKWVLAPVALGIAWGAAALIIFDVVIQHFMFAMYYGHFGNTPSAALETILRHPVFAAEEVRRIHTTYLYNLLSPEGLVLPFTSLISIFAIPNLAISLARGIDISGMAGGISHYSVLVVAAFWLAIANFTGRLQKWLPGKERAVAAFMGVIMVVMVAASVHLWVNFLPKSPPADYQALKQAVAMVPADPSVSVASNDGRAISHLSSRWLITEPLVWDVVQPPDYLAQGTGQLRTDYVIVKPFGNPFYNDAAAFSFLTEPGSHYRLIFQQDDIKLYQRQGS